MISEIWGAVTFHPASSIFLVPFNHCSKTARRSNTKDPDSRKIPDVGLELREAISGALLREGGAQFAARHPE
jgi:hypothetical protein